MKLQNLLYFIKNLNFRQGRIWFLLLFLLLIGQQANAQTGVVKATSGTGLYKDKIFWVNWDLDNDGNPTSHDDDIVEGTVREVTFPSGLKYTITISNVTGAAMQSYRINDFGGNDFVKAYDFIDNKQRVIGIGNRNFGEEIKFRINVVASINGISVPVQGMVVAGAESLDENEFDTFTTSGDAFQLIDRGASSGTYSIPNTLSNGGKTIRADGGSGDGTGIWFTKGTNFVDADMKGGGRQSVAIGFFAPTDFGDAPASYGTPQHALDISFTGATPPENVPFTLGNITLATLNDRQEMIGEIVDEESSILAAVAGADAIGDDNDGMSDEDGLKTSTVVFNNTAVQSVPLVTRNNSGAPANLYVWIDANQDGKFSANEGSLHSVPATATGTQITTVNLNLPEALQTNEQYYMRFRITTTPLTDDPATLDVDERATLSASDGEVEDYRIQVSVSIAGKVNVDANANGVIDAGEALYAATGLNAVLVDGTNKVIRVVPVTAGAYNFTDAPYTTANPSGYKVMITTANPALNSTLPALTSTNPANFVTTFDAGKDANLKSGSNGALASDNVDQVIYTPGEGITNLNFNIQRIPTVTNVTNSSTLSNESTGTTINGLVASDVDGTIASYVISTLPTAAQGILTLSDGTPVTAGQELTPEQAASLKFDPAPNFTGNATFTFTAKDNGGATAAAPATFTIPVGDPSMDLGITKTATPKPAVAGETLEYTITLTNHGPGNLTSTDVITLTDNLPAGFTANSYTAASGTYNSTNGSWTGLALTSGGTTTLKISGTVASSAAGTTLNNTASVTGPSGITDPNTTNNSASDATLVVAAKPSFNIVKSGPSSVNAGEDIFYTLTVQNSGTGDILNAVIADNIPAGIINTSWTTTVSGAATISAGATGTGSNISITGNLPAGAANKILVNITGKVDPAYTGQLLQNTATVDPGNGEPVVSSEQVNTTVKRAADLRIQKAGPTTAVAGADITYTLTASNFGPSDVTGALIKDAIPAGLTNAKWTVQTKGAATTAATSGVGGINLLANLKADGVDQVIITITAKVNPTFSGTIVNTATLTPPANIQDPTPATSTVNTTVSQSANVAITKIGPGNIGAGETIEYTLKITNSGPSTATGTVINDALPAQITDATWTVSTEGGATTTLANGVGNVSFNADLPNGSVVNVVIIGKIDPSLIDGSIINNTATAVSPITDPEPGNNTGSSSFSVDNDAKFRVVKNGPSTTTIGNKITYKILVTNTGFGNIIGAVLTDNVPADVTVTSWTVSAIGASIVTGTASGNTNAISSTFDIPTGASNKIELTVNGTVASTANPSFTNTVSVVAGNVKQSSIVTTVNKSTDISIEKIAPQTAAAGDKITYTLKVKDLGTIGVNGLTINDNVPVAIQNVTWTASAVGTASVTGPLTGTGNAITTTGNISSGNGYILITVTGNIPVNTNVASVSNTATVTLPNGIVDYNLANNTSTVSTAIINRNHLSIIKRGPLVANAGSNISYTIEVSNTGPSNANAAAITDVVPNSLTNVTWATSTTGTATVNTGASGTGNNVSVVGNVPALDGEIVITVTGSISPTFTGDIINTATATPSEPGNVAVTSEPVITKVTLKEIIANPDAGTINDLGGIATNVLPNDSFGDQPASLTQVNLNQISTSNTGVNLDPLTGNVVVSPGTPPGVYTLVYEMVDKNNPNNKVQTTVTITVTDAPLASNPDGGTVNSYPGGQAVPNVLSNDTIGDVPATLDNVNLNQLSTDNPKVAIDPLTGAVNVAPGTPAGTYTIVYEIVDKLDPTNKVQTTVTITVLGTNFAIPNILTLNGDGLNDTFKIKGLENYPGSKLSVYNRWGNEVYHSNNYLNDWDGSKLNEGTYYYLLLRKEKAGTTTPFKGWIFLKR